MAKSISRYLADISSTSGVLDGTISTAAQTNITSLGTLSSLTVSGAMNGTLSTAAQPNITSVGTLTTLAMGGSITRTGDLTLDVSGDIILDADGGDIRFLDGGTEWGRIQNGTGSQLILQSKISDEDMLFQGNDGGSNITALTLDMSDGGSATFNADVSVDRYLKLRTTDDHTNSWLFYTHTDDTLRINYNGTGNDEIVVDTSGNVGIGTGSSTIAFSAGNGLRVESASTATLRLQDTGANGFEIRAHADAAQFYNANNKPFIFYDSSNNDIFHITNTGNVGIGTASPTELLEVNSTGASTAIEVSAGAASTTTGEAKIVLRSLHSASGTTYSRSEIASLGVAGGDSDLIFRTTTDTNGPQERMRIKDTGVTQFKTGDGTSNIAEFHTNASSGSVTGYISFAPQGTIRAYIGTGSSLLSGAAVSDFIIRSEGDLIFNSNGNNERMRISSAGTATFQHPVVVQSGATQGYYIENNAGNAVTPRITNDANDWTIIRPGVSGGDVAINNYANTANRVIFTDEGKVGIGRAPDVTLEVDGPLKITNNTAGGISQTHTNMTVGNSGKLLINFASIGTMTTGDTIVFSYAATSWKSWFFKIRWSSTGGYMGELWAGGYNNNSDGYQILNPRYYAADSGDGSSNGTVEGATLTVTRSGQANTMTLTLNNNHIHPLFEIEYACGGGEGIPNASKATITVNS